MSFTQDAEKLLAQQPECQSIDPDTLMADCEPGCKHEQLQVQRAGIYTGLAIVTHLDGIEVALTAIARQQ